MTSCYLTLYTIDQVTLSCLTLYSSDHVLPNTIQKLPNTLQ